MTVPFAVATAVVAGTGPKASSDLRASSMQTFNNKHSDRLDSAHYCERPQELVRCAAERPAYQQAVSECAKEFLDLVCQAPV